MSGVCCRWREVQLLPLLDRKSSLSLPPAKLPRLNTDKNPVYFTSGAEQDAGPAVSQSASDTRLDKTAEPGCEDSDSSEVRRCLGESGTVSKFNPLTPTVDI